MWIHSGFLALLLSSTLVGNQDAPQKPPEPDKHEAPAKQESAAPQKPEAEKNSGPSILIRAKRVFVRPGEVLEQASVLVRDGKIIAVGKDLAAPKGAQVLEAEVVCAGFLDPWSALCIDSGSWSEPGATAATRAVDAFDPWTPESLRKDTLRAGVTSVRIQAGSYSRTSGVGSVVRVAPQLDLEHAVVNAASCVSMNIGLTSNAGGGQSVEFVDGQPTLVDTRGRPMDTFDRLSDLDRVLSALESGRTYLYSLVDHKHELEDWQKKIVEKETELEKDAKKAKKDREKAQKEAEEKAKTFEDKRYREDKRPQPPRYDEDAEVMSRVADGVLPFFVQAHRVAELRGLVEGTQDFDRLRLVVVGASQARTCAHQLAERGIPVLLWPALRGKGAPEEYTGGDPSLAGDLARSGVSVLLGSGGVDPASTRDLPLLAQLAIGHGLDRVKAFEALTIGAARALDVSDRLGSVERGKDADLLLLDGDPLDAGTRVQRVISAGRLVLNPED
ncbi:MAG: amidohydrolase family protein [Planctomycetes bacterium]|nr:amidohydrolase family protein [Planctomycetota bacterium]